MQGQKVRKICKKRSAIVQLFLLKPNSFLNLIIWEDKSKEKSALAQTRHVQVFLIAQQLCNHGIVVDQVKMDQVRLVMAIR